MKIAGKDYTHQDLKDYLAENEDKLMTGTIRDTDIEVKILAYEKGWVTYISTGNQIPGQTWAGDIITK